MIKLSILIATIGQRRARLERLLNILLPQLRKEVEVIAYWNNGEIPLSEVRQALLEEAKGEYICFVDDDDLIPEYYCQEILTALGKDYIGFQLQAFNDERKLKPTFHSLRYDRWDEDIDGFYRDVSHLNPVKRDLALQASFIVNQGTAEDEPWAIRMKPLLKTENYINRIMYFYHHASQDSVWRGGLEKRYSYERLPVKNKYFRWHPASQEKFKK